MRNPVANLAGWRTYPLRINSAMHNLILVESVADAIKSNSQGHSNLRV